MTKKAVSGFDSLKYSLKVARKVGPLNFVRSLRSRNVCKVCALGMGGQRGGMTNETGGFPEVCKKSIQAQLTDIQPAIPESLFAERSIADFRQIIPRDLERLGRLNSPLYKSADSDYFHTLSWDDALDRVVNAMRAALPERTFFYSSGRSSNEAAFLLQIFARLFGTNNVNNCSYYCHQASGVGLTSIVGSGTATVVLDDVKHADQIWVVGANPSSNHPRLMTELLQCRRRGGDVIIVNPAREPGLVRYSVPSDWRAMLLGDNEIASVFVQPHVGGDIALFKGIAKVLIENGDVSTYFINRYTTDYESYAGDIQQTSWEEITSVSGVDHQEIQELAQRYMDADNIIFCWAMGITHHDHGVENVESIANVALLRGNVGRKYSGLLPLRGHSNVQGIGSVGVTPALKEKVFNNLEQKLGVAVPETPGMDTMSCMTSASNGEIDFALLLGGNLYGATPDSGFAQKALAKIPFKLFISTTLNQGHFFGSEKEVIILPAAARDEESQSTTQESMFNYVRMSDGGINRLDGVRSEVDILVDIASGVVGSSVLDFTVFKEHSEIRKAIAEVIPGFEKMDNMDETREEFQVGGRTFHEPRFATPNGKAHFKTVPIPPLKGADGEFRMCTVRSEGQFNTIIYDKGDEFRGVEHRWVVLMNRGDMQELQLADGDEVNLESDTGVMKRVEAKPFDVKRKNVLTFFPEANVLIPQLVDHRSKTPSFKSNAIRITPCRVD